MGKRDGGDAAPLLFAKRSDRVASRPACQNDCVP